jgi:hypothetical protein
MLKFPIKDWLVLTLPRDLPELRIPAYGSLTIGEFDALIDASPNIGRLTYVRLALSRPEVGLAEEDIEELASHLPRSLGEKIYAWMLEESREWKSEPAEEVEEDSKKSNGTNSDSDSPTTTLQSDFSSLETLLDAPSSLLEKHSNQSS